jgi:FkbM family methyltransferase
MGIPKGQLMSEGGQTMPNPHSAALHQQAVGGAERDASPREVAEHPETGVGTVTNALQGQPAPDLVRQGERRRITISGDLGGKRFAFEMDFDSAFDADMRHIEYLQNGTLFEPEISAVFGRVLRHGDAVIDVGANIGWFTLLAASLVGPSGSVVACEPGPDNQAKLRANINASGFPTRVHLVSQPISDRTETVEFHLNADCSGGHALWDPGLWRDNEKSRKAPQSIRVNGASLDELLVPGREIRLIKIDAEGAEQRVLQGARAIIASHRPPYIVAEVHPFALAQFGHSQESLRQLMAGYGYETFLIFAADMPPVMVPAGARIECAMIFNVLFSTPAAIAECWPMFHLGSVDTTPA